MLEKPAVSKGLARVGSKNKSGSREKESVKKQLNTSNTSADKLPNIDKGKGAKPLVT